MNPFLKRNYMNLKAALLGGFAGACTVNLLHEFLHRNIKDSPRMDKLGMEAITKGIKKAGQERPSEKKLFYMTLAADILSNTLYYSLTGISREENLNRSGSMLGLAAGLGALWLPKPLGLNQKYSNKNFKTGTITLGLYLLGGFVASVVTRELRKNSQAI